ncbi:IS5 family transposase [Roseomonas mucosa]|uniref:IS5 family transposase n=1 Tax=Roseomonas mucosa TaxID=207340 RepID=A0A1S8D0H0_9PROT|nr:IS5 family transposase [Roseomonas mucosa]ONH81254.1 IS5 family transposase [Roseomonas mucosa]
MSKAPTQGSRPKTRYRTRNWREYDRGLIARGDLTVWISPELAWHAEGTGRRGRPQVFTDAAIQAVLTLKVLYQLPLRAAQGMAAGLIRLAGLDWRVPHYSTLSRRQKDLTVAIPYRPRSGPLHLVIDSTGLKVLGEGEWKVRKHGADKRRVWRKVHLVIDADSHEIRAVEMTDHRHGDSEIVPGLLAQLPDDEQIGVISGDGAYDTRGVYEASASRKADLVVPPRRNCKPWKKRTTGATERNETLRAIRHLGRRLWKRWSGYHRRSLAETAMSRLKRLGERLAARGPARQIAEVQIRCAILNTFNTLGMPDTVAVA